MICRPMTKAFLITAMIGSLGLRPMFAEVGVELPWPAQLGVTGMMGALLWWKDRSSNEALKVLGGQHQQANEKLCDEISGLRADYKQFADQQITMMRECLMQRRQQ